LKKTEIVPYEPIHAYEIIERNVREQDIHLSETPDWEEAVEGWKKCGPAFTLLVDNQVVACAGVTILKPGVGEAWSLLSTLFYKNKKTVFRGMRDGLNKITQEYNLRRVQALVYCGFEQGCHLLRHLGFVNETPNGMKAFGPNGEDVFLFRRV
jgi:hypothetical protein